MREKLSVLAAVVFAISTSVLGVSHFGGQSSPAVEPTASANQNVVENQTRSDRLGPSQRNRLRWNYGSRHGV